MSKYDKIMKKVDKFYQNPRHEELYNLDCSIIEFLLPRLRLFIKDSSSVVDWNAHKEEGIDVIKSIESIIADFEFILDNKWSYDKDLAKEYIKRVKRSFKNLGIIYPYLWW